VNGAGRVRHLPRSLDQVMRLRHKLINVVVVAVVYAVDVAWPSVPARPLPITYPTLRAEPGVLRKSYMIS
jgi:hypothetical protein